MGETEATSKTKGPGPMGNECQGSGFSRPHCFPGDHTYTCSPETQQISRITPLPRLELGPGDTEVNRPHWPCPGD